MSLSPVSRAPSVRGLFSFLVLVLCIPLEVAAQECPDLGANGPEMCMKIEERDPGGNVLATWPVGGGRFRTASPFVPILATIGNYQVDLLILSGTAPGGLGVNITDGGSAVMPTATVQRNGGGTSNLVITVDLGVESGLAKTGSVALDGEATGAYFIIGSGGVGNHSDLGEPVYHPFPQLAEASDANGGPFDENHLGQILPAWIEPVALRAILGIGIPNVDDSIPLPNSFTARVGARPYASSLHSERSGLPDKLQTNPKSSSS